MLIAQGWWKINEKFSDSNNIFYDTRYKQKNKTKNKKQKTKKGIFLSLGFQVMHDYVCFIAPIDYRVEHVE